MRPLQSSGVAEVVGCSLSGDGRESPAQLLELALPGMELGLGWFCASPELPRLERECLGPPNEMGELRTSAFRLGRAEGRSGLHARSRAPLATDGHCSVAMLKA